MIPMIEAAFRTAAMALARGADRLAPTAAATRRRAIGVAAITGGADREEPVAEPAGALAERGVDHVGAATRSDWTRRANRGTTDTTGSGCRSTEVVTEGLEVSAPGPHLSLIAAFSLRDARPIAHAAEAVDAGAPMDAQTASTAAWKSRPEREIPTAPTAIIVY
jgi:hypothetical protein